MKNDLDHTLTVDTVAGELSSRRSGSAELVPPTAAPTSRSGARWYWICQLTGWFLVFAINLYFSWYTQPKDVVKFSIIYAWSAASGMWLTHRWRALLRKYAWLEQQRGLPWLRLSMGVIWLAIIQVGLVSAVFYLLRPANTFKNWYWLPPALLGWAFILGMWTVFYATVHARRRIVHIQLEKLRLEISIKDAELRALQAQVNPHFFFNSLNSIRALIYQDTAMAAQAVEQLADMMRYSLQTGRNATVQLAQEMEAVRNYLAIEKIRFEDRLRYHESIADELMHIAIPPMALQTLVENAVKYGVESRADGCEIRISAVRVGSQLQLTVANQGSLGQQRNSTQLGLANAARRLALLFGPSASASIMESEGWVLATLKLPGEAA
ncbi:MAG: sensor histidine kinase [Pseudomonadota bacterium]